ncbi:proline racemase family protein [Ornithinimicrobium cavernae]|uniref:proline racemase family protein n=1 Tax=Ornithinimicrobium cavernae TaxID=2666047 RepID=UPI000D694099|nr:proline racemase family protein [Ornithinimicrobium cavernae]
MLTRRVLNTIDVHAEGELGKVVIASHLQIRGTTMLERLAHAQEHFEGVRRLLLREPRGYPAACAVLVLPPVETDSDFAMIVMEQGGFRAMSGSNLICAVTALVETQTVTVDSPQLTLRIDTLAGLVEAHVEVANGRAMSVTFDNVPSFAVELDYPLEVPGYGTVPVDIAFGGQFYVQARARDLGVELSKEQTPQVIRAGSVLRAAAIQHFAVRHPLQEGIDEIGLAMIHGPADVPSTDAGRNAVVMPNGVVDLEDPTTWTGVIDRSPCGTGTSARMAARFARGEMAVGDTFSHQGLLGTTFVGTVRGTTQVGSHEAILPSIRGRGWIIAHNQYVLAEDDPFPEGYTVGDIWGPEGP